jgi:hypothetical protein
MTKKTSKKSIIKVLNKPIINLLYIFEAALSENDIGFKLAKRAVFSAVVSNQVDQYIFSLRRLRPFDLL